MKRCAADTRSWPGDHHGGHQRPAVLRGRHRPDRGRLRLTGVRVVVSVLAALVVGLVLAACTTTVEGKPVPATGSVDPSGGEPPKAPRPADRNPQAVTMALRKLDACGVLDLNAARAAGNPRASLMPMGPHACMLVPTATYSPGDRGVEVSVGDGSNDFFLYTGKPVTVGGAKAYEYRDYKTSKRCELFFPVSFTRSIRFQYDSFDKDVDTCRILHQLAETSVARLQNPDAITVDPATRPGSAWDGCFFLAQLLGENAGDYTYQPTGVYDPFSGCETHERKKDDKAKTPAGNTFSPKLEIRYDQVPKTPKEGRSVAGKVAEVTNYGASGCALTWNQGDSGTGNQWYAALVVKLTAGTCDTAAQLAEKAIPLASQAPPDASAQPQRPLLYKPDENDNPEIGACVDFSVAGGTTDCEPYHEVGVPHGTEAIMAGAARNRNVECAVFADPVKALYGPSFGALTWGAHCFFVEPTHSVILRVNVDPKNPPSDYGKGNGYTDRRETQIAGKPAVTFWNRDKSAFDVYVSPFGDLSRKGNVHIAVEARPTRGDGSSIAAQLDAAKADTGTQVITQVIQRNFTG